MTGGGAATNSGIDFQQRLGALAMVAMLVNLADLSTFGLGASGQKPTEIRFETSDGIDDIVINTENARIFVQAKNTISLSADESSELAKVIQQFVKQLSQDGAAGSRDEFLLAVSQGASMRITKELKKLCAMVRLNETGSTSNPLTKSEKETLSIVNAHIDREFTKYTGTILTNAQRAELWKRMRVHAFDVFDGGATERLAITALSAEIRRDATLVWNSLVAIGLTLAKDRLSLDQAGLLERVGRYFVSTPPATLSTDIQLIQRGSLQAGREVLLVQDKDGRVILTDLKRFEEDGRPRVRFEGDAVVFGEDFRWTVLRRTSTYDGMTREVLASDLVNQSAALIAMPSNFPEDLNSSPAALAHSSLCERLLQENPEPLSCLQCGRPISEHGAYFIEVDEEGLPHEVGLVHRRCLRPLHRILGTAGNDLFANNPALTDFDFATWVKQLSSGQGVFNGPLKMPSPTPIAWNPENGEPFVGNHAISYSLSDGTTRYVLSRGRVARYPKQIAATLAEGFNNRIAAEAATGDPMSANDNGFAKTSLLISLGDPTPPRVLSATPCEVSRSTIWAHSTVENYYAPLFYLASMTSGEIFLIADAAVLLTDPLRLGSMTANWSNAGLALDEYATVILATDAEFDLFMYRLKSHGLQVVIDPLLGIDGRLLSGILITSMDELMQAEQSRHAAATGES